MASPLLATWFMVSYPHMSTGRPAAVSGAALLLITLLIVAGVSSAAWFSYSVRKSSEPAKKAEEAAVVTASSERAGPRSLLVSSEGAYLIEGQSSKRVLWPEDLELLGLPLSSLSGVDVMTAESMSLENGFGQRPALGILSPDGQRSVSPAKRKRDGTGTVEVKYGNISTNFVLRTPTGFGIRDARPIGWFDQETIAVEGLSTSSRAIFSLGLNGKVKHVSNLPVYIERLTFGEGSVWYVQVTPGEGLEDASRPPTEIRRLKPDGSYETAVLEPEKVIGRFIIGKDYLAYVEGQGKAFLVKIGSDEKILLGESMPLFFSGGLLYLRRGLEGIIYDAANGQESRLPIELRQGAALFALP